MFSPNRSKRWSCLIDSTFFVFTIWIPKHETIQVWLIQKQNFNSIFPWEKYGYGLKSIFKRKNIDFQNEYNCQNKILKIICKSLPAVTKIQVPNQKKEDVWSIGNVIKIRLSVSNVFGKFLHLFACLIKQMPCTSVSVIR